LDNSKAVRVLNYPIDLKKISTLFVNRDNFGEIKPQTISS